MSNRFTAEDFRQAGEAFDFDNGTDPHSPVIQHALRIAERVRAEPSKKIIRLVAENTEYSAEHWYHEIELIINAYRATLLADEEPLSVVEQISDRSAP